MKKLFKLSMPFGLILSLSTCVITTPIEIAASVVEGAVDIIAGVIGGTVDIIVPDGDDCDSTNEDGDDDCKI